MTLISPYPSSDLAHSSLVGSASLISSHRAGTQEADMSRIGDLVSTQHTSNLKVNQSAHLGRLSRQTPCLLAETVQGVSLLAPYWLQEGRALDRTEQSCTCPGLFPGLLFSKGPTSASLYD